MKERTNHILLAIAVITVIVSIAAALYTYNIVNDFKDTWVTGFATSQSNATVNLTVNAITAINFTTNFINFGSGTVSAGSGNATLDTSAGTVTGGNFTANSAGFVLENIGNTNLSLDIYTTKSAASFLGGTSPLYQYNVSNVEASACANTTGAVGTLPLNTFQTVNTTSPGTRVCDVFRFLDSTDRIRIDLRLGVPYDSTTGALTDTIVATATSL